MKKRSLLGLLAVLPLSLLTACGSGGGGGDAKVRLINASPGYASLDMYVDDNEKATAVAFGSASSFASVKSDDLTVALTAASSSTELLTSNRTFESDKKYSIVAYGWDGSLSSASLLEDEDEPDSGKTLFSVFNLANDAGSVDVYLTAEADDLASATAVRASVTGNSRSSFSTVTAGTYRLRVTAAGDASDVRLDYSGLVLPSKGIETLILTPTPGGVLVNGMTLEQDGGLTQQLNTKARARVVANTAGGSAVAMSVGGVSLGTSSRSPAIKDYVVVNAGTSQTVVATVDGAALAASPVTIGAGEDLTFLVTGAGAASVVTPFKDDNRLPTVSTKYKIRMIHGSNVLAGEALTLSVDLADTVNDQEFGTSSTFQTVTASTESDFAVTSLSSTTPVFTLTDQAVTAKGVYTMFVYDTAAGVATGRLKKER